MYSNKDWNLYKQKIVVWQERHMENLISKYQAMLDENAPASMRFWDLNKSIREDQKSVGVQCVLARSEMLSQIPHLLSEGIITLDDLDGFSDELVERVSTFGDEYNY